MAATLTASISASVGWNYQTVLTGSITPGVSFGFTYSKSLTSGTGAAGTADLIYAIQTTIAGGASATYDLSGSLADWFGTTITMARMKFMFIKLTSDTLASGVSVGNATNALGGWISDATKTVKIYQDGIFLTGGGGATQFAIVGGATDAIKVLNDDGSVTATLQLCFIGSSA